MTEPEIETETSKFPDLSKLFTVRNVVETIAGVSTKFVVTSAIASLVPTETRAEKAKVYVGSYVIAGVVVERGKAHISDKYDEYAGYVSAVMQAVQNLEATEPDPENVHKITTL